MSLLPPYTPGMRHPDPPNNPYVGSGSPEGVVVGSPPRTYLDSDTNELWFKASGDGTNTGWVLVSASGSEATVGTGSPEGVVTADPGSRFFATDTRTMWFKETGEGNTGWIEEFTLPS